MAVSAPVSIDQRFAQLIQQFGLTKNSFAISLGKTASVVQHLIDGRNKPGYDLLCKVFEIYPNVSRDWLLLGKGPMLVGEPAPKPAVPAASVPQELPLEPIDLSDIEAPASRRSGPGVAGTRLQPAEIAATLALAAAANQPVRTATPMPSFDSSVAAHPAPAPAAVATAPAAEAPGIPKETQAEAAAAPAAPSVAAPAPAVAPAFLPSPTIPPATAGMGPETYVSAALHAQYMQHQLALAELRNQHLVEQQQMLREMLAMARQSMV